MLRSRGWAEGPETYSAPPRPVGEAAWQPWKWQPEMVGEPPAIEAQPPLVAAPLMTRKPAGCGVAGQRAGGQVGKRISAGMQWIR